MNDVKSMIVRKSMRLPSRMKNLATRFGSLVLLFQRMPVVQMLFPQANLIGGATMANSFSVAVTTVVGLGAYDSVAGATTIDEVLPLAVTGATSSRTTTANAINVPATVSAALNFKFQCINAPSDPESWKIVTSGGATASLPTGLSMLYTTSTPSDGNGGFLQENFITGTPATAGTHAVYVRVYRDPGQTGDNVTQLFNICALGFSTQPVSTTINSGGTTTLSCVATGIPVATTRHPASPTVSYQWYRGASGTTTTPVGTNSSSFTTPSLSATTSYWVKVTSVLGTSTVSANSGTATVTVNAGDTTPPSVTINQAAAQTDPTKVATINYTVVFSESVSNFATGDVTVGGTAGGTKTATVTGSGTTYNVAVAGMTSSGTVIPSLAAGVASDAAGNLSLASTSTDNTVTYDSVAPTVAVTPAGTNSKTSPITYTLTFSEPVTGLTTAGITVTNGTKGSLSGSGTTYTLPVTPTAQGAVTCQVTAAAASDAAANGNTVSNTASVTYDSVAPTVAVTPSGTSSTSSPITFTLTFSEPVTGLAASGVTVTNGTKGALSGSGTTYTIPVTPTAAGAVTCLVTAGAAADTATNTNTVSNTATVTYSIPDPFTSWASGLPVGKNGVMDIPQNDGITNLMKFACNLNPLAADTRKLTVGGNQTAGLPGQTMVGGKIRMEFLRRKASTNPGVSYMLQFSSDMGGTSWSSQDVSSSPAGTSIDATWERVVIDDTVGGNKRFARLKVTKP